MQGPLPPRLVRSKPLTTLSSLRLAHHRRLFYAAATAHARTTALATWSSYSHQPPCYRSRLLRVSCRLQVTAIHSSSSWRRCSSESHRRHRARSRIRSNLPTLLPHYFLQLYSLQRRRCSHVAPSISVLVRNSSDGPVHVGSFELFLARINTRTIIKLLQPFLTSPPIRLRHTSQLQPTRSQRRDPSFPFRSSLVSTLPSYFPSRQYSLFPPDQSILSSSTSRKHLVTTSRRTSPAAKPNTQSSQFAQSRSVTKWER